MMEDTYTQLFTGHVHDIQWRLKKAQDDTFDQLTQTIPMSDERKMDLADQLTRLRSRCCSESFALGIELGLRVAWEFPDQ